MWWKKPKESATERKRMVDSQIRTRGVKNKAVIDAMLKVPRHIFIPENLRRYAYADEPQPIGEGQTISQPYIVALMTELLDPQSTDRVLEVGAGSGYQAAVLAELVSHVYSLEIVPALAKRTKKLLEKMDYKNISVIQGNGYQGYPQEAPFDKVIVTAAPPSLPKALTDQLKIGGRLVIPVGEFYQVLFVYTKKKDGIQSRDVIPVRFVPMTGGK